MNMLCQECTKKLLCTSLCPEAELYVSQDEIPQRELTIGMPIYVDKPWPEPKQKPLFTSMEMRVLDTLLDGRTRNQTAQLLGITRHSVREHLKNIRKKRQNKLTNNRRTSMSAECESSQSQEDKERGE